MLKPEGLWPVDAEFAELYSSVCAGGREEASKSGVNIVSIARNAMPKLTNTLKLLDGVRGGFSRCQMFVFENDSTDGTDSALDGHAARNDWFTVEHDTWGGTDSRGFERERTERLAKARNICFEWVKANGASNEYTIVLDLDPDMGFSVDGVFNSVGWMADLHRSHIQAGAMASFSLLRVATSEEVRIAHYDAWAARLNWWRDRRDEDGGMSWFSLLMPPVGSPPIRLNSAFGGLCVYRTEAFLSGGYSGEDCEHVPHHKRMAEAGWSLFLNPGCRYIAFWK
jgi:glycosyltransferase involved in cell wall biosynthesis